MADSPPASPLNSTTELPPHFEVPAAFLDPGADVLLKSSDDVLFKVHKNILCLGSGFFANMFSDAGSAADTAQEYSPITWTEPASTIVALLSYLYPNIALLEVLTAEDILALTIAADKWDMDRVLTAMRAEMKKPTILEERPMAIYNLACRFGFEDVKRLAGRRLINAYDPHDPTLRSDLPGLSAVDFVALSDLRTNCIEYARRIHRQSLPSPKYLGMSMFQVNFSCGYTHPQWVQNAMLRIKTALDGYPEEEVAGLDDRPGSRLPAVLLALDKPAAHSLSF